MLLRGLLQLREGALSKLLGLAMGSWGLAISGAILEFLDVALVCSGLLRSLKSPCVTEGCGTAALYSSALFAVMVTIYEISASFIPKPSGYFTHSQSCLNQRRSTLWVQQGVGVRKDPDPAEPPGRRQSLEGLQAMKGRVGVETRSHHWLR